MFPSTSIQIVRCIIFKFTILFYFSFSFFPYVVQKIFPIINFPISTFHHEHHTECKVKSSVTRINTYSANIFNVFPPSPRFSLHLQFTQQIPNIYFLSSVDIVHMSVMNTILSL